MARSAYQDFVASYIKSNDGATIKEAAAAWNAQKGQGKTASPSGAAAQGSGSAPAFSRGHIRRRSD